MANRGRPLGTVGEYKEIKKTVQLAFRVTEEQKKLIIEKAMKNNMNISEYMNHLIMQDK